VLRISMSVQSPEIVLSYLRVEQSREDSGIGPPQSHINDRNSKSSKRLHEGDSNSKSVVWLLIDFEMEAPHHVLVEIA